MRRAIPGPRRFERKVRRDAMRLELKDYSRLVRVWPTPKPNREIYQ